MIIVVALIEATIEPNKINKPITIPIPKRITASQNKPLKNSLASFRIDTVDSFISFHWCLQKFLIDQFLFLWAYGIYNQEKQTNIAKIDPAIKYKFDTNSVGLGSTILGYKVRNSQTDMTQTTKSIFPNSINFVFNQVFIFFIQKAHHR